MKVTNLSNISKNTDIVKIVVACLVATLIILTNGCKDRNTDQQAKIRKAEAEHQVSIYLDKMRAKADCERQNGVVITDKDGNMINCVFPPRP